ncbi:MAG: plasmid mobilization relaxosome protein MobC [Pseudomonadota bacterium]
MIGLSSQFGSAGLQPKPSSANSKKRTRDCPRVTVRLSHDDYAKLTELANGMSLSVYMRAKALNDELPRRRASCVPIEDRVAIAKIIGLLGQSRIANNLNQLAYHANVGALEFDDTAKVQIEEAYACILDMRSLLLKALGRKP